MGSATAAGASVSSRMILMRAAFFTLCALVFLPALAQAKHGGVTRHYKFDIKMQNVTRLCQTKSIVTVNGQLPGLESSLEKATGS